MYDNLPVIDCHGHMSTPPEFRAHAMNLQSNRSPRNAPLRIDENRLKLSTNRHIQMLDERNIDVQMISPRPVAMMHYERPFIVHNWTTTTNDVIKELCEALPDRFVGVAQLPQNSEQDTSHYIKEFERAINELGFVAALVNPDPGADRKFPGMNDETWFPLYEASESLDAPLIVHPSVSKDPRLDIIPSSYQYNNLTEEVLAILLLRNSDVFERFPRLRVIVCHCGGALDRFIPNAPSSGQAGGGQAISAQAAPAEQSHDDVRDLSNNLFIDSCAYDPDFLRTAIKQWGVNQVIFGTEAPGSGTSDLNVETNRPSDDLIPVFEHFDFLTNEDRRKILHDNAIRVFPRLTSTAALAGK
jgi:predicted TIM-barrel fold metal-dependent hydrolase